MVSHIRASPNQETVLWFYGWKIPKTEEFSYDKEALLSGEAPLKWVSKFPASVFNQSDDTFGESKLLNLDLSEEASKDIGIIASHSFLILLVKQFLIRPEIVKQQKGRDKTLRAYFSDMLNSRTGDFKELKRNYFVMNPMKELGRDATAVVYEGNQKSRNSLISKVCTSTSGWLLRRSFQGLLAIRQSVTGSSMRPKSPRIYSIHKFSELSVSSTDHPPLIVMGNSELPLPTYD